LNFATAVAKLEKIKNADTICTIPKLQPVVAEL